MRRDYDVAVVGAGLVGAAIAYGLAKDGRRVCLLDEGDIALRASRANFALVWVQTKGHGYPPYAILTHRSASLWSSFAQEVEAETGVDLGFQQPGGFTFALSEEELEGRRRILDEVQAQPGVPDLGSRIVLRNELISLIPEAGPEVVGASYCAKDGHCNSPRLLLALHRGFGMRGGDLLTNRTVETITAGRDGFSILGEGEEIQAGKIVLAAGLGNIRLAPMVGLDAPLQPLKGQLIVTEKVRPFLHYPLVNLRQTDEGGVMIGSSMEDMGFDTSSVVPVVANMAKRAIRLFPLLAEANIVRSWAGLRIMTPDGFPLYEQSQEAPGAFLCNCHSGVTLAAAHAGDLAQAIGRGNLDGFGAFSGERLRVQAAQ